MKRIAKFIIILFALMFASAAVYGASGWFDAWRYSDDFAQQAQALAKRGLGENAIGSEKQAILLRVEDPSFSVNNGTDFSTPGAGKTTITQSLSKRLAFTDFKPGIRKIRQTGHALGLSQFMTKSDILTLFLAETPFKSRDGRWITGFDAASRHFFAKPVAALDRDQFILLIASGVAPADLHADAPNEKLLERVSRINRLIAGQCKPSDHGDVWLEGCAL